MIKYKVWITAALIGVAVGLSAQTKSKSKSKSQNKSAGINLSFWKNKATQPMDSLQTSYLNLGLVTTLYRADGLSVNVISGVAYERVNGVQVSGIANLVNHNMQGVQLAGITNVNGTDLMGLSVSGLVNIVGMDMYGVMATGLYNITGESNGVMASGMVNVSGKEAAGLQLAGIANIASSTLYGVQVGGMLNLVSASTYGLQLSPLGNLTAHQLHGAQIGLLNFATRAKGVQIGLVNYYKDSMKGMQLGLVNANPQTNVQLMLFGGNATKFNAAARFKNDLFYTIVGGGTNYLDFSDKFSAALFYRAGLWLPVYKTFSVSGDLGYQHIETFKNKDYGIPARLYSLQARLNLEVQVSSKLAVFATGGYGGSRVYGRNLTHDKGVIVEAGVVLF